MSRISRKNASLLIGFMVIMASLTFCQSSNSDRTLPAEWETKEAVWIGFRTNASGSRYDSVTIPIIKILSESITTNILIESSSLLPEGKSYFVSFGIDTSRINIIYHSPLNIWLRDTGPMMVFNHEKLIQACDFKYTHYNNIPFDSTDSISKSYEGLDREIASLIGIETINSSLTLEGGAIESDGAGTLILVDSLLLKRNPGLSKKQIEKELQRTLGANTFIWLNEGLIQDSQGSTYLGDMFWANGTGGHTDQFVRFANDSTILLAWEFEISNQKDSLRIINNKRLERNFQILTKATNHKGEKFSIIKIPISDHFYQTRQINSALQKGLSDVPDYQYTDTVKMLACTSYLNYLIANKLVIIPKYWRVGLPLSQKNKDDSVLKIFREIFPDYSIHQVNPLELNYSGGGLHCIYFTQPKISNNY
jgi:agmatine deiminase